LLTSAPDFDNADYRFTVPNIVAELKECTTDFGEAKEYQERIYALAEKHITTGTMSFRQALGVDPQSREFATEFVRLFRPPLSRILKKANRQIKATKGHFGWPQAHGILFLVNDGFRSLAPDLVGAVVQDLLLTSYTSIDCFIYMTVNTYVAVPTRDSANLLWAPSYRESTPDSVVQFVDTLGTKWFTYLAELLGPWDASLKTPDRGVLGGSRSIPSRDLPRPEP